MLLPDAVGTMNSTFLCGAHPCDRAVGINACESAMTKPSVVLFMPFTIAMLPVSCALSAGGGLTGFAPDRLSCHLP